MHERKMHFNRKTYLVLTFILLLLIAASTLVISATGSEPSFSEQLTFTLDLDAPYFNYSQARFNDSSTLSEIEFEFRENKTIGIIIPKNSQVTKAEFNLTGVIRPYMQCIGTAGTENDCTMARSTAISAIAVAEIDPSHDSQEIAITTSENTDTVNTIFITNNTGSVIWARKSTTTQYPSRDIALGSFINNENDSIVAGDYGINVYDTSGNMIWNYSAGGTAVNSVAIGNLTNGAENELVYGDNNGLVAILNTSSNTTGNLCNISLVGNINSLVISDIGEDGQNEILAASNQKLYIIDSACNEVWNYTTSNYIINSIAVKNLTTDSGKEIILGTRSITTGGKYYLINSTGSFLWNRTTPADILSVVAGEFDYINPGYEILGGTGGYHIQLLNSNGTIYWTYNTSTETEVSALALGNLSHDTGYNTNELVLGTQGTFFDKGNLQILNFDNFPTNITMDIGADASIEWNYTEGDGRLRNTTTANNTELLTAINSYIQNNCTQDLCTIPITFHSDIEGILEVRINLEYTYNASGNINATFINYWTKTNNLHVNESIIARAKNITFTDPAQNITIKYININSSAIQCGFDGENYTNATLNGINYCSISSRTPIFKSVPGENISKILWDDQMEKEIPVTMNTSLSYFTKGLDNYFWQKNISIISNNTYTDQSFTNITANITLNDSSDAVRGNEYLNVTWGAETCNIIPSTEQSTCNTAPPETPMTCNSTLFYVCKKDTDGNGVYEFIKWIHPILNAIQQVFYQAGGASNLNPNLTNANVTPQENTWNTYFNYSIHVNDTENDLVNITLLTYSELTHTWQHRQSKNITGQGTAWFNISLEKEMTGTNNKYKFLYQDFNTTWSSPVHSEAHTKNNTGPNVTKHNIEITEMTGNNTDVIRGDGNQTLLVVRINDTTQNKYIDETGVLCTFNITYDKTNFNETYTTTVNDTGHCNHTFAPNHTYGIGTQTWLVTVDPRYYLSPPSPVNWTLNIMGKLNLSLPIPAYNQVHTRNTTLDMTAHLINQYNEDINSSTITIQDYNCSWYFNNTYLTTTTLNESGYCNYSYTPNCTYTHLKDYEIEVKLNYTQNPRNYTIITNTSQTTIQLKDNITITIDSPIYASAYYKGETVELNSTINDTCATCAQNSWQVSWYKDLHAIKFQLNETRGFARNNTPVIITGAQLESAGANLTGWQVNSTKITGPNSTIPNKIFGADGIYLNSTSEIVFLVNLTTYSTNTYHITRNESQVSGTYTTSYIKNSGFEGNSKDSWTGDGVIVNDASEKGNYSLKIECNKDNSPHTITQALHPITTQNIKLWYKHTGEYDPVNSGIRVKIGTYLCEIPIPHLTGNFVNESWRTYTCSNESLLDKENISITVYTNTTGNSELYIDHICIADNAGNCISEDHGITDNRGITAQLLINTTEDTLWTIPMDQHLGKRKITAVATGDYYYTKENSTQIYIYGRSRASTFDYSSTGCDGNLCFGGSVIDLTCKIIDANTTSPIYNYNVSFYDGATLLNTNGSFTNSQGYATYSWASSTDSGNHTISCNISDAPNLYYNASIPDSNSTTIYIFTNNTNATLSFKEDTIYVNTTSITAHNLTKHRNDLINISILINNTGQSVVSSPEIIAYNRSNITIITGKYSAISNLGNHQDNITVNISRYAPLGNTTLNVTLIWANNDTQFINQTITINVTNTTILEITNKTTLNYAIPYGGTKQIGNFTIEAYGNTPLSNIQFSLEDGDYQELQNWTITYSNESFDIARFQNQTITVTITVPSNVTLLGRNFWTYIVANNTGTQCTETYENCTDRIKINITVIDQDWQFTPVEEITKTVGLGGNDIIGSFDDLINITNLKNQNMTINISIINTNSTGFVNFTYIFNSTTHDLNTTESTFHIPPLSFANINITYNITGAQLTDKGTYTFNISIHNLNADSVPQWVNKTVTFTISALYVEIISPNATHPATDIVAGDILNFTLNVTYDGNILNDTENTTFAIKISGENCTINSTQFNQQQNNWRINCTAPRIPQNTQNNTVDATVTYNTPDSLQISYTATEQNLVIYRDITSPYINRLIINSIPLLPENEANLKIESATNPIYLEINATDNVGVNNVWLTITDPKNNVTALTPTQNISSPDIWNCTYTNPNHLGDYNVTIHANDSIENHTTTQIMWFDVYREIDFTDTLTDASNNIVTADFELYKSGTDWAFHRFSTNSDGFYNWSTHKRTYDIKMTALGQIIRFNNFNITSSAINKTGQSDPSSLSGAIKLHLIPNNSLETNASKISLPNTAQNTLMAFIIHTPQMDYDNATIKLHYSNALLSSGTSYDESKLRIYYCTTWDFYSQICTGGEFTELNSSLAPDMVSQIFTFTTTHNTAYAIAKWCDGNICGASPPVEPGSPGGGDSGSGSTQRAVCGNNICETGENEQNCPEDCTYHVCGNGICEPTENKDNCPEDCSALDFEYKTDTDFINIQIAPGENKTHTLTILNRNNNSIFITITRTGDILDYIDISEEEFTLPARSNKTVTLLIHTEKDTTPDTYSGAITISSGASKQRLPVIIRISKTTPADLTSLEMTIEMITKKITPKDTLRFHVMLYNLGIIKEFNVTLSYNIKEAKTENIVKTTQETLLLTGNRNFRKSIDLSDLNPDIHTGQYFIEVTADYGPKKITSTDTFEVVQSFWATTRGQVLLAAILLILLALLAWYGYKRYRIWKLSKARYVFPLKYSRLPHADNAFSIGKIAETNKTAHFNPDDLTTHILTSGSTGAGKSVAASVIVEEALKQKIPVVVFDPTAQWTGFVRPCKDNNLLKYYQQFGMRQQDARPFPGMIFEVTDPNVKIDFKKYMNPGEITIFTLNKLKPGEYDTAVKCIIDTIFSVQWEESTTLKMIVVFDEVHRLLEKYGGKGGYISLEKACREFRKWGIGLVMCSQVYSDFKEAIQGNILTEIQLNTKSMADIAKVKEKYGPEYSEKISRQGVGVGMVQNPRYNDGKPWFIQFRPTIHSPHKITEEEMKLYKEFAEKLDKIERRIEKLKQGRVNTMDLELELKLAKTKLKQGQFKMAEIYIQSLLSRKIISMS